MSFFPYFVCVLLGVDSLRGGLAEGNRISKNFHVPLNSLSSAKTAKPSLARGHMGGADWGYLELGPGTLKKFYRTQVQIHTQWPQYAKKF